MVRMTSLLDWYSQTDNQFIKVHRNNEVTLSQCLDSNSWSDVYWFISEAYDQFSAEQKHDLRIFGCKKALINIEKIKPYCSEYNYQLIIDYLNNPTEEARSAVKSVTWSVAKSAVDSSAKLAALSAAWSAAKLAAWSAVESAEKSASMEENIRDLRELFVKWESK